MKIDTNKIEGWLLATKTRPIKAKPLINLLVDRTIVSKFLVNTLEGREPLGDGVVICVGEAGDAWQQMPNKLLSKYDVTGIDKDGWMVCIPKLDNSVNVKEITDLFLSSKSEALKDYPDDRMYNLGRFAISGHWGDNAYPTLGKNIQWGDMGDFICQSRTDSTDVWIVKRKLFLNTYNLF